MSREIKIEEVELHNSEKSVWMIIHDEVYDVTKFLEEHPGGADSLLDYAGKDGTQGFEDVGHSDDAREMMKQFKIGSLPADQRKIVAKPLSGLTQLNQDVIVLAATRPTQSYSKIKKDSETTRPDRRVQSVVVPRERRRRSSGAPPSSGSNLKWALFALAGAIIIGIAMKKYMT